MRRVKDQPWQYEHNGWHIATLGGFCTIKRFSATKNGALVWSFKLKELPPRLDAFDRGEDFEFKELYTKPLYV